jgi:S-formylglutathione hydrolase
MTKLRVDLGELASDLIPNPALYAVLVPENEPGPLPLCLTLHGGGSNRDFLVEQAPLLEGLINAGQLPPMVFATASTGEMSFYFDHPDGSAHWESFISEFFLAHIRKSYPVRSDRDGTVITGVSMGGYGSLKIAFRHPERFLAVAAMEPALEPALRAADRGARNSFFYPDDFPSELTLPSSAPEVWQANQPSVRARANADAIRESGLAVYLEVGDDDGLLLHDGTEFLHRVLWDLDISHEYHLVRNGDHLGPSLPSRIVETFSWLGAALMQEASAEVPLSEEEHAWMAWAERGFSGDRPPPMNPVSPGAAKMLRMQFAPALEKAAKADPSTRRRFGRLPKPD